VTALGCGVGKNFDLGAHALRQGHHPRRRGFRRTPHATLLLTFLFRHLPQLITSAASISRNRRSIASISARKPTGPLTNSRKS
jgi:hypothetical protein